MSKRRDTFSPHHKRERTKKTSLLFEKRRKAERWREEVYVYISNIYRFVGVTGIIIIIIIIYRRSRSSTGSIKTVRSAICVYVYSIAFDLAWCVYIISS